RSRAALRPGGTARRYLEYLERLGRAVVEPRYGTAGRPENRYRLTTTPLPKELARRRHHAVAKGARSSAALPSGGQPPKPWECGPRSMPHLERWRGTSQQGQRVPLSGEAGRRSGPRGKI